MQASWQGAHYCANVELDGSPWAAQGHLLTCSSTSGLKAPSLTLTRAAMHLLGPLQTLATLLATGLKLNGGPCIAQRHLLTYVKYTRPSGTFGLAEMADAPATDLNLTGNPCAAQKHLLTYPEYTWRTGTFSYDDKNGNAFSGVSANGADGASIGAGSVTNSGQGDTVSFGEGNGTPGGDVQSTAVGSSKSEVSLSYHSILQWDQA